LPISSQANLNVNCNQDIIEGDINADSSSPISLTKSKQNLNKGEVGVPAPKNKAYYNDKYLKKKSGKYQPTALE
jgi:hypothetical protein